MTRQRNQFPKKKTRNNDLHSPQGHYTVRTRRRVLDVQIEGIDVNTVPDILTFSDFHGSSPLPTDERSSGHVDNKEERILRHWIYTGKSSCHSHYSAYP